MGRNDELAAWEPCFEQLGDSAAVPIVHRHYYVNEHNNRHSAIGEVFSQREEEAQSQAVPVPFAVQGTGREGATVVETDFERDVFERMLAGVAA